MTMLRKKQYASYSGFDWYGNKCRNAKCGVDVFCGVEMMRSVTNRVQPASGVRTLSNRPVRNVVFETEIHPKNSIEAHKD
jgi:hypothetical protein